MTEGGAAVKMPADGDAGKGGGGNKEGGRGGVREQVLRDSRLGMAARERVESGHEAEESDEGMVGVREREREAEVARERRRQARMIDALHGRGDGGIGAGVGGAAASPEALQGLTPAERAAVHLSAVAPFSVSQ